MCGELSDVWSVVRMAEIIYSGMATVVYTRARSVVDSTQDWNRSDVGSKPAHCFGKSAKRHLAKRQPAPSHIACRIRIPARHAGRLAAKAF